MMERLTEWANNLFAAPKPSVDSQIDMAMTRSRITLIRTVAEFEQAKKDLADQYNRQVLAWSLALNDLMIERKTPSREQFEKQLQAFQTALEASVHQNMVCQTNPEYHHVSTRQVLDAALRIEKAKLLALVFADGKTEVAKVAMDFIIEHGLPETL